MRSRLHCIYIAYPCARFLHRKWSCISRTLGDDMLAARCLMLNSHLIDRYFSVHLTTNIGDVKLLTNVFYGYRYLLARSTVKPLITKTSEEFNKCRLDNFLMSFILYYVNFSICENKLPLICGNSFKEFHIII